ncbi:IS3 family transposase [Lentibacillus salinarum]|uniref:IS3 family transposase n=1 Tax=Lentibacillus salinarum TaxID=446820 RepID=A0ABW3ZR20_9BACI
MNAHIESFHRILEDNCLSGCEFETYGEAYKAIIEFMDFYNNRRIHSSILGLTPKEFYELQKSGKTGIKDIRVYPPIPFFLRFVPALKSANS